MSRINVEVIKDKIDIVELISNYTEVKRRGSNSYMAYCPLDGHNDKTPSLSIDKKKGLWNCFGCGEGGDVITFIERMEGVEFKEAIKLLINNSSIDYEEIQITEYRVNDFNINKLMEAIKLYNNTKFLDKQLLEKYNQTHRYFIEKGFKQETLDYFNIGYCSDVNDDLYNRVTIPWFDSKDRLVAINGRDITETKGKKYYLKKGSTKKSTLYNLSNLDKNDKPIILVESEKDVWWLYQSGYKRVVALGGTSLGKRKWLLRKYTNKVILALDGDIAGMKARAKITKSLYNLMDIYAVNIPQSKDVSDLNKQEIDNAFNNKTKFKGGV